MATQLTNPCSLALAANPQSGIRLLTSSWASFCLGYIYLLLAQHTIKEKKAGLTYQRQEKAAQTTIARTITAVKPLIRAVSQSGGASLFSFRGNSVGIEGIVCMFSFDTTSFITLLKAFCEVSRALLLTDDSTPCACGCGCRRGDQSQPSYFQKAPLQGEHAHIRIGLLVIELSLEVPDFMAALFS